jgi:hypothetical protein
LVSGDFTVSERHGHPLVTTIAKDIVLDPAKHMATSQNATCPNCF